MLPPPQPPSLTQNSSWEPNRKLIFEFLPMRRLASIRSHPDFPLHYSWAGKSSHITSLKNLLSVIIKFKAFYCKNLSSKQMKYTSWMCWRIVLHPSKKFSQTNWKRRFKLTNSAFFWLVAQRMWKRINQQRKVITLEFKSFLTSFSISFHFLSESVGWRTMDDSLFP